MKPNTPNTCFLSIAIALGLLLLSGASSFAQVAPQEMNYQGRLTDNSPQQSPLQATLAMEFRIYGSLVGADILWSESWPSVQVNDGLFTVLLGSNSAPLPASVFNSDERYLEIEVDGEILTPRQKLGSVAFAQQAEKSADLACTDCVSSNEIADGQVQQVDLANDSIGTDQIQNNSITGADIATDAVTSGDIATGAVGTLELASEAVSEVKIKDSAITPTKVDVSGDYYMNSLELLSPNEGLRVSAGDDSFSTGNTQIALQSYRLDKAHSIRTRHHLSDPEQNGIDFYVWDPTVDAVGELGSRKVMTLQEGTLQVGDVEEIGCADGTVEQRFSSGSNSTKTEMVGCQANASYSSRAQACAPGWHVCSAEEWSDNRGAKTPEENYWVEDRLRYSGDADDCSVGTTSGNFCGGGAMKVCAPNGGCTWNYCNSNQSQVHEYFGGCAPSVASTLCCSGDPEAEVFEFFDTGGDDVTSQWINNHFVNRVDGTDWWLFLEFDQVGLDPAQYCFANAAFYTSSYLAATPGSSTDADPGYQKFYRTNAAFSWQETYATRNVSYGGSCRAGSQWAWCPIAGLPGSVYSIAPDLASLAELLPINGQAGFRMRIGPTRESTCGF